MLVFRLDNHQLSVRCILLKLKECLIIKEEKEKEKEKEKKKDKRKRKMMIEAEESVKEVPK